MLPTVRTALCLFKLQADKTPMKVSLMILSPLADKMVPVVAMLQKPYPVFPVGKAVPLRLKLQNIVAELKRIAAVATAVVAVMEETAGKGVRVETAVGAPIVKRTHLVVKVGTAVTEDVGDAEETEGKVARSFYIIKKIGAAETRRNGTLAVAKED